MIVSEKNSLDFNKVVAFVWALTPFMQHYVVPGIGSNLAFSSLIMIGCLYLFLAKDRVVIQQGDDRGSLVTKTVIIMFFYCTLHMLFFPPALVYRGYVDSFPVVVIQFAFLLLCVAVFNNTEVRNHYFDYIEIIAIVMTIVVAFQVLVYMGTGITFSEDRSFLFPFKSYFEYDVKQTLLNSHMVIDGLFRPSAFFIEPAHYSQFCLIGLVASLARSEQLLNKKAIIITVGIILTTSGIGIVSSLMLWALKMIITEKGITNKVIIRCLMGLLLLMCLVVVLFLVSSSFKMAVIRIVVASNGHHSAIGGRLSSIALLGDLSTTELLFGMGYHNIPTYGIAEIQYYMTGIVQLLYCQGIIGTSIFGICYIWMMIKAFRKKSMLPLYALILYIPFLIGTANLGILSLVQYFPLLYYERKG